ncbi:beta-hydroxyacyl-ACP dehydratase [bacterium]|nr:beta-hydroxyacyl-ACP dehydratase [bacterium]
MKFTLIDKILSCNGKDKITAVKNLSLGEEYLSDHFPGYPVMPGVLMIEAMVQTANWLIRILTDFSVSMFVMEEARNVKYGKFVVPGDRLELSIILKEIDKNYASFKGKGMLNGDVAVSAQFKIHFFNLAEQDIKLAFNDKLLRDNARKIFNELGGAKISERAHNIRST